MSFSANILANKAYLKHVRGDLEAAKPLYEKAFKKGMKSPNHLSAYGVLLMMEGSFEKSIEIFTKIVEAKPNNTVLNKARLNRAIAYTKLKEYDKAKAALEDLYETYRTVRVYEALGYLYVLKDDEKSEELNLEAYDYDPENYVILDNLCQHYLNQKDYINARKYGELAYEAQEGKADNLYHMAVIEAHDKNTDKAKEYCQAMMEAKITALNDVTHEQRLAKYKDIVGRDYTE